MKCFECGQIELIKKTYHSYNKKHFCNECYSKHIVTCKCCGKTTSDLTSLSELKESEFRKTLRERSSFTSRSWIKLVELSELSEQFSSLTLCPECASSKLKLCRECDTLVVEGINSYVQGTCSECGPWVIVHDILPPHDSIYYGDTRQVIYKGVKGYTKQNLATGYSAQQCANCGEIWVYDLNDPYAEETFCPHCLALAQTCELCGSTFIPKVTPLDITSGDKDFKAVIQELGTKFCPICLRDSIKSYHSNHAEELTFCDTTECEDQNFGASASNSKLYLGFELEMESTLGNNEAMLAAFKVMERIGPRYISITHDGSLHNGFEVVSCPATIEFYHKHWNDIYKPLCDTAKSLKMLSQKSGNCGLHVHLSRSFFDASEGGGDRVGFFLEYFFPEILMFSRRAKDNLNYCAPKLWTNSAHCSPSEIMENCTGWGHSSMFNVHCVATKEIRVWRGTLNDQTLLATLELCDFIAKFVKSTSYTDIAATSWSTIVEMIDSDESMKVCSAYLKLLPKVDESKFRRNGTLYPKPYNMLDSNSEMPGQF